MVNSVVMNARLTKDVTTTTTKGGLVIANIPVVNNRRTKVGEEWKDVPSYFDVVLMGKRASALEPYLTKGQMVTIKGILVQRTWEKNGVKNSKVEIHADDIELIGGKREAKEQKPQTSGPEDFPDDDFDF